MIMTRGKKLRWRGTGAGAACPCLASSNRNEDGHEPTPNGAEADSASTTSRRVSSLRRRVRRRVSDIECSAPTCEEGKRHRGGRNAEPPAELHRGIRRQTHVFPFQNMTGGPTTSRLKTSLGKPGTPHKPNCNKQTHAMNRGLGKKTKCRCSACTRISPAARTAKKIPNTQRREVTEGKLMVLLASPHVPGHICSDDAWHEAPAKRHCRGRSTSWPGVEQQESRWA